LRKMEGRVILGEERKRERMGEEKELSREKISEVLWMLKEKKAMGVDGIPGEAWRYGDEKECGGFVMRFGRREDGRRNRRKE